MRFVALKTEAQLDVQVLHRVRDRLVGQRTSLMNQMRSILLERGIVVPQGRRSLLDALAAVSAEGDASGLGRRVRLLLDDMLDQWRTLDARIAALDDEFADMARSDPAARRLATIPGVGVMNATALVAAIGDGRTFSRGRDLAAWMGLVPRQATTGGKPKLLGITKRGSKYLRKLIIQGARAALPALARSATPIGAWLRDLLARAHGNTVVVALAAKLIRIAWALLRNGTTCRTPAQPRLKQDRCTAEPDAARRRRVCGRWTRDGLTVDRCSASLRRKMALDAGPFMRLGTRGSPSWPGLSLRPDTLMQTDQTRAQKPLADGAGHTFAPAAETWARTMVESNICTRCAVSLRPPRRRRRPRTRRPGSGARTASRPSSSCRNAQAGPAR